MMIKLRLSDEERQQLADTMKATRDPRLRTRCQAILMADRGRRHGHIAEDWGVSVRTVQRWLNLYHERGAAGLKIRWAPGRVAKLPEALAAEILAWLKQGPAGCGLDRANWTYQELATYLYRTKGLTVSESTLRMFCRRHGVRPYRPTYRYLKAEPGQQEAARQDLQALKKSRSRRARIAESG
jgi:transposase